MSEPIEWADPPDRRKKRGDVAATIAELKSRPGNWAIVRRATSPGTARTFQAHGMETRLVSVGLSETGRPAYDVYARWNGGA